MKTKEFISVLVGCVLLAKLTKQLKPGSCVDGTYLSTYMIKEGTCVVCPRQLSDCEKEKIADQSSCFGRCAKKYPSSHSTNTVFPSFHETSLYTSSTKKMSSKTTSGAIITSSPTIQNTTSVMKKGIVDKTSLYTSPTKKTSRKIASSIIITSSPTVQNTASVMKEGIVDKTWFFVVMVLVACLICAIIGSYVLHDRCTQPKRLMPVNVEEPEDCERNRANNLELNEPGLRGSNTRLGGIQPEDEILLQDPDPSYRSSSLIGDENNS